MGTVIRKRTAWLPSSAGSCGSFPPFAGITTLGVPKVNELLRQEAEKLLRATRYAGILGMDFRLDNRDGQYKLLDFNPRLGTNFRMFEDSGGVDVVRTMHLDLTGRKVARLPGGSINHMRFG